MHVDKGSEAGSLNFLTPCSAFVGGGLWLEHASGTCFPMEYMATPNLCMGRRSASSGRVLCQAREIFASCCPFIFTLRRVSEGHSTHARGG